MPAPTQQQINNIAVSLERAIRVTHAPGAVLYVGDRDTTYLHAARGFRQITPHRRPAVEDTLYDLASLTKVIATTTAVMLLRDEGKISLDQSITEFVPVPAFRHMKLIHLMTHTSGLVPGNPYYKDASSLEEMFARYATEGIRTEPGKQRVYSDVGFMLLGKMVETVAQDSLDAFCQRRIFDPLGMTRTRYRPPRSWAENAAATERCPWRGRVMIGEVHDENAYAVGGVAGHAGLFSTAPDLATFCRALMSGKILNQATFAEMIAMNKVPTYPWQGLGWLVDPWPTKLQGFLPARAAIGHTGWTGTSIWMDTDSGLFAILLGNTCHPSRARRDNGRFRRITHDAIAEVFYPRSTNTHSGLDRVYREDFESIAKRRIAVLTNHAAIDQFSRPIQDVLEMSDTTRIVRFFSPEHGLQGQAEAGESVGAQRAAIPVTSLYGDRKAPTQEELRGIELFVVDLQDVGSRYYTYAATMKRCMEACGQARVPVLVLDRPNPLGGTVLEGPIAVNTSSLVCWAAVPIRHGMTMGEIAMYFTRTELSRLNIRLAINRLDTWRDDFLFQESSLPWISPSPNIPTPETALLYAGMCLIEGTNLNEGRGTETPFSLIGAPWIDAESIVRSLPPELLAGIQVVPAEYTPRSIPGKASSPKFQDQLCRGVEVKIADAHAARPFSAAVALLEAIRKRHPDEFQWNDFFDTLAGGPYLRRQIVDGQAAPKIIDALNAPIRQYDRSRPKLYEPEE